METRGAYSLLEFTGIVAMFTDDIVFEASFGKEPWGTRAVGKPAARALAREVFHRIPDAHFEELRHFICPEYAAVTS